MAQQVIDVGATPNDGEGDPIRTSFIFTNENFTELYARAQATPPVSLVGSPGDVAGMYAYDANYFYYCFANYDGSSVIWAQVSQIGNISISSLTNGTSNIQVGLNANVTVGVAGSSNVVVIASTGEFVQGIISASGNITGDYILGNGSQLSGLPELYGNANVANYLPVFSGNLSAGNIAVTTAVSATGNISAGNLVVANNIAATGNILTGGIISTSGNIAAQGRISATGNIETTGYFVGTFVGNVTGNFVIPGSNTQVVFNTNGNADATAGLTFDTNGPNLLTVLGTISSQGNVVAGNITTSNVVTATGNIIGGNLRTAGAVTATGNVTAGNVVTAGAVTATGNVTAGNVVTAGAVTATGNVTGQNLFTGGVITAIGNITGGNLRAITDVNVGGNVAATGYTGTSLSVTANVTGGNIRTAGAVTATGNITGNYFIGNGSQLSGIDATSIQNGNSNVRVATVNGNVTVSIAGVSPMTIFANTGVYVDGVVSASGNITGGNIRTAGAISATGGITSAGNVTGANIVATANLYYNGNTLVTRSLTIGTRDTPVVLALTAAGSFIVETRDSGNVTITTST